MVKSEINMKIVRRVDYDSIYNKMIYRAIVRVYLKPSREVEKDIGLVRLRAESPQLLENKIRLVRTKFNQLLKENPEFVKKIGKSETMIIDEDE